VPRPVSSEASAMGCDGCASRPMTERVGRFKPDRRSGSGKRYPQGLRGPVSHQKMNAPTAFKSGLQVRASPVQSAKFGPFGFAPKLSASGSALSLFPVLALHQAGPRLHLLERKASRNPFC
jgi:hypothetical protein